MQITEVSVNSLIPYEFNNVRHPEQQVDRIANSIKEFGFNVPLIVNKDNIIIAGHGRLEAAKKLGLKTVPVLRKDELTPAQEKAYRILDNKLTRDSDWDFDNIQVDFAFLAEEGFDFAKWGLEDFVPKGSIEPIAVVNDNYDVPDLDEVEPFIKRGDLIELGEHRVFCGDSRESGDIDILVNGNVLDMIVTDPPYGVSYVGKTKEALTLQNDDLNEEGLEYLWVTTCEAWLSVEREGGAFYAAVPPGPLNLVFLRILCGLGVYRQQLIWVKDSMVLGHSDYHYKHEPILYGWKPGAAHTFTEDRTKVSVLEFARPKASKEHPTMKPIELWAELIQNSSKAGNNVGDPFLGSGTTLIACEQLGRKCFGIEIEPKYCQVIIDRYKKLCEKLNKPFNCKINGESFSG